MNGANPTDDCIDGGNAKATGSAFASTEPAESPHLVKKGRITVIRGDFPEGFDWGAFLEEEMNEQLRRVMGWSDQ